MTLPAHVQDYIDERQSPVEERREWENQMLSVLETRVLEMLNSTKRSRKDKGFAESAEHLVITQDLITSLPNASLKKVDALIQSLHKETLTGLENEVSDIMDENLVSSVESAQAQGEMARLVQGATFPNIKKAMAITEHWRKEAKLRAPILKIVRDHEALLLRAIKTEESPEGKLHEQRCASLGTDICASFKNVDKYLQMYSDSAGRTLTLHDQPYEAILRKQKGQMGKVWTDFQNYTREVLLLLNTEDDEIDMGTGDMEERRRLLPVKYGFLHLKSPGHPTIAEWSEREVFCVLRGGLLCYFEIDGDLQPKGMMPLEGAHVENVAKNVPGALYPARECFKVASPKADRTFYVHADSVDKKDGWLRLISQHMEQVTHMKSDLVKSGNAERPWSENFALKEQVKTAVHVGFMTKSGGILNLSWKRRMMVLNGDHLTYYQPPHGVKAKGFFQPLSCELDTSHDLAIQIPAECVLSLETNHGPLLVGTRDPIQRDAWRTALSNSVL